MSFFSITKALQNKLGTISNDIDTVIEGLPYTPVEGTPFQVVNIIPDMPMNPTFGDGYYREQGIMRVRLLYPDRQGKGRIILKGEQIRETFYRGLSLPEDDIVVIINYTPRFSNITTVGDRIVMAVDISYFTSVYPT